MQTSIGTLVKDLRTGQKLSLRALERKSGIAQSTIGRWENGRFSPRLEELRVVLGALGIPLDQQQSALAMINAPRSDRFLRKALMLQALAPDELEPPTEGKLLRTIRHRGGQTLGEVANSLHTTVRTVSRWERSESTPPLVMIEAFCIFLGATHEEMCALKSSALKANLAGGGASPQRLKDGLQLLLKTERKSGSMALDLPFMILEAGAWALGRMDQEYRSILLQIYTAYAQWLMDMARIGEAGAYIDRAQVITGQRPEWKIAATVVNNLADELMARQAKSARMANCPFA